MNRYTYDPYGGVTSSSGTVANPWRFGGADGAHTDTATGLVKSGARYYDPTVGRWTQQDPKVMPFDPVQANRYSYAGCSPVNYADPTGLDHCGAKEWFKGGLGVIGGAALVVGATASLPVSGPPSAFVGPVAGIVFGATIFLNGQVDLADCATR